MEATALSCVILVFWCLFAVPTVFYALSVHVSKKNKQYIVSVCVCVCKFGGGVCNFGTGLSCMP